MTLKIAINYSPNFSIKSRNRKNIKFLLIHYTVIRNEKKAIDKLIYKVNLTPDLNGKLSTEEVFLKFIDEFNNEARVRLRNRRRWICWMCLGIKIM